MSQRCEENTTTPTRKTKINYNKTNIKKIGEGGWGGGEYFLQIFSYSL